MFAEGMSERRFDHRKVALGDLGEEFSKGILRGVAACDALVNLHTEVERTVAVAAEEYFDVVIDVAVADGSDEGRGDEDGVVLREHRVLREDFEECRGVRPGLFVGFDRDRSELLEVFEVLVERSLGDVGVVNEFLDGKSTLLKEVRVLCFAFDVFFDVEGEPDVGQPGGRKEVPTPMMFSTSVPWLRISSVTALLTKLYEFLGMRKVFRSYRKLRIAIRGLY